MTNTSSIKNLSFKIWSDGGARGNPGPAATGYIIKNDLDKIIISKGVYIGHATNNIAEYTAALQAIDSLLNHLNSLNQNYKIESIIMYLDSLLIVNQLKGKFKIKQPNLLKIATQIIQRITKNKLPISFYHIPREDNYLADQQVNIALDLQLSN